MRLAANLVSDAIHWFGYRHDSANQVGAKVQDRKSRKPKILSAAESHRILIGSGRYIISEKQFASRGELDDWLAVNTLLSKENVEDLFAHRELELKEETGKTEWYKYIPPVKKTAR